MRTLARSQLKAMTPSDSSASLAQWWQTFRTLVGDDAYERYCAHQGAHHPNEPLLNRRAFYLKAQQEKWNGIKRCC